MSAVILPPRPLSVPAAALLSLALSLAMDGGRARADPLNGSSTALGVVSNVQQSGTAPAPATITSAASGGGSAYVITSNANRTLIDWNSFALASGDSLNFALAARDAIAVNRIAAGAASVNGVLTSTVAGSYGGSVWFIAPSGVAFGSGAVVNVGGLLATPSPLSLSDAAFLASSDSATFTFAAAASGATVSVASGASLSAHGGVLAVVAPAISTQAGATIGGDAGNTQLLYGAAKAFEIQLSPSAQNDLDLVSFVIDAPSDSSAPLSLAGASNAGNVYVTGAASIVDALISLPGDLTATQASSQGGVIVLSAGGVASRGQRFDPTAPGASTAGSAITATAGTLAADGYIDINAAGALSLGAISSGQTVNAATSGVLTLRNPVSAASDIILSGTGTVGGVSGAAVSLTSTSGIIDVSGGLTATASYAFSASTTTSLQGDAAARAADSGGLPLSLTFSSSAPQTLGAIATGSASLSVRAAGDLTLGALTSGAATLTAGGNLVLAGNATTQSLDIEASGTASQTAPIVTDTLTGRAASLTFDQAANQIANLGPFTSGGGLSLVDAAPLTVAGALTGGGPVALTTTSGGLTLADAIGASGQSLTLTSAGAISQTGGSIAAASLTGSAVGAASLSQPGNLIANLGPFTAGTGFALVDAEALTVSGALTSTGGAAALATTSGDITLAGAVNVSGQTLSLASAGAINQTGGTLAAGALTGASVGGANLTQSGNQIANLGPFTAGAGLALVDATPLTLAGAVNASGQSLSLISAGAITQTGGAITAATLTGSSVGAASFTQPGNQIANLGPFTAGAGFALADAEALTVTGALNSMGGPAALTTTSGGITLTGAINAPGQTLSLISAGAISQTDGAITASILTGSSVGAASLTQSGNQIANLGSFTAGAGLALVDATPLTLAGAVNASGQTLSLTVAGAITQTVGAITAGALTGSSVGAASFTQPGNQIANLGPFTAGAGFALADAEAWTVTGPLNSAGGGVALTTTSGGITLAGAIDAAGQSLSLSSAGAISQTGGTLAAAILTGASAGAASFNQPGNLVATLGPFTAGAGFALVDAQALTVAGALNSPGGAVSLTTTSGDIALAGAGQIGGDLTVMSATGQITQAGAIAVSESTRYLAAGAITLDGGSIVSGADIDLTAQSGSVSIITPVTAPAAFTSLNAVGRTRLTAQNGSILIGESPFVGAVESFLAQYPGAALNVSLGLPPVAQLPTLGRIFIGSGTLQMSASGAIVQQNSTPFPGQSTGIVLDNPTRQAQPLAIGGGDSGSPSVVDLFLTLVNAGGTTITGKVVATSGAIDLAVPATNFYRVNGCVIGQAGVCTVLNDAIVNIEPANLTGDLLLQSLPNAPISDPTIAGTGNEEIWRKRH